jgi:signal transduction histidine kinase
MNNINLLELIHERWLTRVSHLLAPGEGIRESFEKELNRFFDLLKQSVEAGNPAWLAPVLDDWADASTESELESSEASLYPMLNQILLITYDVAKDVLTPEQCLDLIGALLPVYTYAVGYAITRESHLHISHVTNELQRAQAELERMDKRKSDFISVSAHELKTPLTLIEGYASILRESLLAQDNQTQFEVVLSGIDDGTKRLQEIIEDMIDVSLIDIDLLSINFHPVRIRQIISIIEEEVLNSIKSRNQTLTIADFDGSQEIIYADPERLYQSLKNIITNGIKYTPDGGAITIDGRRLSGFIEITITDNGIGIDPENHASIFEKFGLQKNVTLHSSGKVKFKGGGPGLGLPIAKGIIEAHGGSIWVESEGYDEVECLGSTFHILLPVHSELPDDKSDKLFDPVSKRTSTNLSILTTEE